MLGVCETVEAKRRCIVYVSGPYSDSPEQRTMEAMESGSILMDRGFSVVVPHLSHYMEQVRSQSYEAWMQQDLVLVERCDALFRLPGVSPGADREVCHAQCLGIPVFDDYLSLETWWYNGGLPGSEYRTSLRRRMAISASPLDEVLLDMAVSLRDLTTVTRRSR